MAGRRINDHSFWAGRSSSESIFPIGSKSKQETSAEGSGSLSRYEDTTEAIRSTQMAGEKKAKAHDMRPGYRY